MTGTDARAAEASIREARPKDLPRLREILDTEILTSAASWTTFVRSEAEMAAWFNDRVAAGFPVLVAMRSWSEEANGDASHGPFRNGDD